MFRRVCGRRRSVRRKSRRGPGCSARPHIVARLARVVKDMCGRHVRMSTQARSSAIGELGDQKYRSVALPRAPRQLLTSNPESNAQKWRMLKRKLLPLVSHLRPSQ